jgi:NitT/TauT family transport system permease protein
LSRRGAASSLAWRLAPFGGIAALLAAWSIAVALSGSHVIPGPLAVVRGLIELARRGLLFRFAVASLFRVTVGFLLAVVTGIPVGLLLGSTRNAALALNPFLQILRPISPLAWIPIAILGFGVGDLSAIFIIFIGSFFPLALTAMNAVQRVPQVSLNAGRNFGLGRRQLLLRVALPAAVPDIIVGVRLSLGVAWLVVVAAEMISVNSGLGFLIVDSRNAGDRYDLVIGGMVLIGVIGLILDGGIRRLEASAALRWVAGSRSEVK